MQPKYPHLYLKDWPFAVVPDERFEAIWADRKAILNDILIILNGLARRPNSTINLLWAWFGSGKSHTLRHMEYLCLTRFQQILPLYSEFPKSVNSFVDLYRYFIQSARVSIIKSVRMLKPHDLELKIEAVRRIAPGVALELANLAQTEIFNEDNFLMGVNSADEAVTALQGLIQFLSSGPHQRVLWLIDEFQRLEKMGPKLKNEINVGLHSLFNACPNGLGLIFSFSIRAKEDALRVLSKELVDRIGVSKIIQIPMMTEVDSQQFIADLLYEFRYQEDAVPGPFFPFTEDSVKYLIHIIKENSELKPRTLMQYFAAVLDQADFLIASKQAKEIDIPMVRKLLAGFDVLVVNQMTDAEAA
jgi:hypothetical protein